MLFKLLAGIIVVLVTGMMLARRRNALPRGRAAQPVPRVPQAEDLVRCARCGVWLPTAQRCNCAGRA
jgi:hypothetical protein